MKKIAEVMTTNRINIDPSGNFLTQFHKDVCRTIVEYCANYFNLNDTTIMVYLDRECKNDEWGSSWQHQEPHHYGVAICVTQGLRDFVATVVHEMIHINQWETGEWEGDGEAEAYGLQFTITDELWKEGVL